MLVLQVCWAATYYIYWKWRSSGFCSRAPSACHPQQPCFAWALKHSPPTCRVLTSCPSTRTGQYPLQSCFVCSALSACSRVATIQSMQHKVRHASVSTSGVDVTFFIILAICFGQGRPKPSVSSQQQNTYQITFMYSPSTDVSAIFYLLLFPPPGGMPTTKLCTWRSCLTAS